MEGAVQIHISVWFLASHSSGRGGRVSSFTFQWVSSFTFQWEFLASHSHEGYSFTLQSGVARITCCWMFSKYQNWMHVNVFLFFSFFFHVKFVRPNQQSTLNSRLHNVSEMLNSLQIFQS